MLLRQDLELILGIGCALRRAGMEWIGDEPEEPAGASRASIEILRPGRATLFFELDSDRTTIGRAATNTIVLDDVRVSRFHAIIERGRNGSWSLTDLGTFSSILLDGQQLKANIPAPLTGRHVIRIAEYQLVFSRMTFELRDGPEARSEVLAIGQPLAAGRLLDVARILETGEGLSGMLDQTVSWIVEQFPRAAGGVVLIPRHTTDGRTRLAVDSFHHRGALRGRLISNSNLARRTFELSEPMLLISLPPEIQFSDERGADGSSRAWLSVPLPGLDARPVGLIQIFSVPFHPEWSRLAPPDPHTELTPDVAFTVEDLTQLTRLAFSLGLALDLRTIETSDADRACRESLDGLPSPDSPRIHGYSLTVAPTDHDFDGDFCDVISREDDRGQGSPPTCVVAIGHATGRTLAAALVVTDLRLEIRRLLREDLDLEQIMTRLNRILHESAAQPLGASVLLAEIDAADHRLQVVAAGPCHAVHSRRDVEERVGSTSSPVEGPPLGISPVADCASTTLFLKPGDVAELTVDASEDASGLTPRTLCTISRESAR